MVGCTFILRGSSCKGYFYACLSLSSTTGIYCVLTIFILAIVFTYHSNSSASSKEFSLLEACRFAKEKAREEWSKDAEIYYVLLTFRTLTRSKQRIFYLVFQNNFLTNTTSDGNPFFTIAGRSV
ncbi:hypothetical protein GK1011 [Geobacillus kaustophilus HTA426]|uniref:Uncharacterized protein n=1 Tax=Geobacillus kaustophilus (strain HTA426) TaxID=235909 RepID=Q5L184_GEOKA|nr:hypothetical protein GK1011 [Geobacillus kaustophilus HTA426]